MTYASPLPSSQAVLNGRRVWGIGAVASVICHRMRAAGRTGQGKPPLLGGLAIRASGRRMTGGRGAVGRAFCLPNRASHPSTSVGLLRRGWLGVRSDGAADMQALGRSGEALAADAGASDVKGLIGVLRAFHHASPTKRGPLRPLKPCINGLPAHAPVTFDRRSRPFRLHIRPTSAGVQKLH